MPRRASRWVIQETKDGKWNLSRGGRDLYTGLSSQTLCVSRMRNYYKDGETVFLEEPDGYRTNITNQLKKKGLI